MTRNHMICHYNLILTNPHISQHQSQKEQLVQEEIKVNQANQQGEKKILPKQHQPQHTCLTRYKTILEKAMIWGANATLFLILYVVLD